MSKVKKILAIIIMLIFTVLSCYNISFADDEKFTCSITSSKQEVEIGQEVTLTFAISNITGFEKGIMGVSAEIEYDEDVLEYVSKTDLNDWNVTYIDATKIIEIDRSDYVNEAEEMVKLTFKVKETSKEETTIKIKEILTSREYIDDEGKKQEEDVETSDISTTLKIAKKQEEQPTNPTPDKPNDDGNLTPEEPTPGEPTPEEPTPGEQEKNPASETPTGKDEQQKKEKPQEYSKLGIEQAYIPIICIAFVVIGIVSYIQYKKYKNIK